MLPQTFVSALVTSCSLGVALPGYAQTPAPQRPQSLKSIEDSDSTIEAQPLHFRFEPVALAAAADASDAWRFDLDTWAWAASINGTVGVRGLTTDVNASFIDILQNSDSILGIAGRLEVGKGKWAGFVDGMYMKIGVENLSGPVGFTDIDMTMKMGLVDFGLMYRLCDHPTSSGDRSTTVDAYAGARYTSLSLELDPANASPRSRDRGWIDPIVGAKVAMPLGERWQLSAWGDIGGFGVSSDFTWSVTAIITYNFELFNRPASVYGGYRAIGDDYSNGSGNDKFVCDVILHGPIIGFTLFF